MRLTSRSLPRLLLLLVGAVALLGGVAWSATAAGFGPAAADDPLPAAAEPAPEVRLTGAGLLAWLDAVGTLESLDAVAENVPFGGKRFFEERTGTDFVPILRTRVEAAVGSGISLAELDARLDDIDGDGDPASDVHGLDGVTVDLDVDLEPRTAPGSYDVRIALQATVAQDRPLTMSLDGLRINGRDAADALTFDLATTLRLDPSATEKVVILADTAELGTVRLGVDGAYDAVQNPLAFRIGVLGVRATGTVRAEAGVRLTLDDPDADGVITLAELATPLPLVRSTCVSSGAQIDLTVTTDLAGLTGEAGRIELDDPGLCNGLSAPDVALGALDQFRDVTLPDVVNGLAQVTQALRSAQAAGDVPLPFVQEPLRDLVSVNERLVTFFVDNGFTDADNPMSTISVDTSDTAVVTSLQDLVPRLAAALGLETSALAVRYDAGRVLLDLETTGDPAALDAGLDLGETLTGLGVDEVDLTGTPQVSVDPSYSLDLGVGFQVGGGTPFDERFFLTNGPDGRVAALDAPVTADLDVDAALAVIGLRLTDDDPEGAVPLLQRRDPSKPMFGLALLDPDKNGRTTLAELAAEGALPVKATLNAAVPSTTLAAEADILGTPVASGSVTVAWPDLAVPSGLAVTADRSFLDTAFPFAFDTSDPRRLITQVLTATRETITQMRAVVADGQATTTAPLPLIGRSVADLDPVLVRLQSAVDRLLQANDVLTLPGLKETLDRVLATELGHDPEVAAPSIVTFDYEPRTPTTAATLLVELDLGACSADRESESEGCSVVGESVEAPFNLDLGAGSRVGGVAGVGTEGTLEVGYDARAHLAFGVELPRLDVAPGADPTKPPAPATAAPVLFVRDDTSLDHRVGARLDGVLTAGLGPVQVSLGRAGEGQPRAHAAVATRFRLEDPDPTERRLRIGSPELTTWLGSLLPKPGQTSVSETEPALRATCPGVTEAVDACATLPVFSDDLALGTITFTAPDLLTPSGWTVDSSDVEAHLRNEAIQFSLLVDGVRTLTGQIAEGLRRLPTGTRIPLLGADVTAGAEVLRKFDEAVLAKVDALAGQMVGVSTAGQVRSRALAALQGLPGGATPTVTLRCRDEAGTGVGDCEESTPSHRLQSFEVGVRVTTGKVASSTEFDIGFPGFRLATDKKITASAGLDVQLRFGVDRDLGFYVPTDGAQPEIALTAGVDLPETMKGDLAFVPVVITDENDEAKPLDASVTAGLDLRTARPDGRLPLADLGRAQLSPTLQADVGLVLGLQTEKPSGALSAMPTFATDLHLGTRLTWNGTSPTPQFSNEVFSFKDVTMDAGALFTDVLKPVADTLHEFTGPLEKPIAAIRKPIPAVAEAAKMVGKPAPTWYDAFKAADAAGNGGQSKGMQLIDRVISLVDLVKAFAGPSVPSGSIKLGTFDVLPAKARTPVPLAEADSLIASTSGTAGPDILGRLQFSGADELAEARKDGGFSFPAFKDPKSLFGMLLGKDVTLAYFDAGKLEVKRGFQFSYPLGPARLYIGGGAGVEGHFAAGFDTYGLRKAFEMLSDDDDTNNGAWSLTAGLLQGLYLDDFDQSGKDVPEIRFSAYLSAGAAIGIPGIEAGAEGGVEGAVEFNLKADDTGKVRYTTIADQLDLNPNPLCFFDASATVDAYVKAYVKTFFGSVSYPIVNKRIYHQENLLGSFCRVRQQGVKQLATIDANKTLVFKTSPTAPDDDLTVVQRGPKQVELSARGLVEVYDGVEGVRADLGAGDDVVVVEQPAEGIAPLPVMLCGGSGSDRLLVAAGKAFVYGDDGDGCVGAAEPGDDDLTTGSGDDLVDGGEGSDTIDTGPGDDTVVGGEGDDALRGGLGTDRIDGGDGTDVSDYSDHTADLAIDLAGVSGQPGETDRHTDVEQVVGGPGDDAITVPADARQQVDGGAGDDVVTGGTGSVQVVGGDGADRFVGGTGPAEFLGAGGDDVFVDGPGPQTFLGMDGRDTADYSGNDVAVRVDLDGEPGDGPIGAGNDNMHDADVVIGTAHADQLVGSSAAEELRGGAGKDALSGGGGGDVLLGEEGDDELVGGAGADRLVGGAGDEVLRGGTDGDTLLGDAGNDDLDGQDGNDSLDGGEGADRVRGGPGSDDLNGGTGLDWVDYSDRTDDLRVTKEGTANDGSTGERDNLRPDVERYVGGSGADHVTGWPGTGEHKDEVFEGNDGDDVIEGMTGDDLIDGGAGDDVLHDTDRNGWLSVADRTADTFVGGPGDDEAYGNGGEDTFLLGDGDDDARSGPQTDTFWAGDGDDDIRAGAGADLVRGEGGDDTLRGEDGDDTLWAGESVLGNATIFGGMGSDTIHNGTNGGGVRTGISGGSDEADDSPNVVFASAEDTGARSTYYGALGDDEFHLGPGDDTVHPLAGDDVVRTGDGANTVDGSVGDDTITGGTGRDGLHGGPGDDTIDGGGGNDGVHGDGGADMLDGGAGDDLVEGGAGADLITGGTNADTLRGDGDTDTLTYADRTTPVVVREDGNRTEGGVEDVSVDPASPTVRDWIAWGDIERVVGGSADDSLTLRHPSRTDDVELDGGAGDDVLTIGIAVDATLVGGPGDDSMSGHAGADRFDQRDAPDGADVMVGGGGADVADYGARPRGTVRVTFDGVADDGATGEGDDVRPDVETARGADSEEPPVTVAVGDVRVIEGGPGTTTPARVSVTLSRPGAADVALPWTVTPGTATAGTDFQAGSGTVTVPAGASSATFDVPVLGDALDEPDETATVSVGDPAVTATLTIVDDDTPVAPVVPRLVVKPAAIAEGKKGLRSMTFRISLSAPTTVPVSVRLSTANGTAKATSDYLAASQVITFAPGQTTATFTVKVKGDRAKEKNETLKVVASSPAGLTAGGPAVGTIRNDDKAKKRR